MIVYNNVNYYTATELTNMIEHPKTELEHKLSDTFHEVYNKVSYVTVSYVQAKLYTAVKHKYIRYIYYSKTEGKIPHKGFAIEDVIDFLNKPISKNIQQNTGEIKTATIIEAEV